MDKIKLLIIAFLSFAACQHLAAQSDVELTDSISNEWGGDTGGGIMPEIPSHPVTSLTLSHTGITIEGGERFRLIAETNSNASNKRVVWSVADDGIARVAKDGTVFGLKIGSTTVKATSVSNPEIKASCNVTVTSDYVEMSSGWILPWGKEEPWDMNYLYFEQSDYKEPSLDNNGKNWKELDYDDTTWRTLTGPMGSLGISYSTYNYEWMGENNCFCLRRTFTLPTVGDGTYSFSMQHDDDIVVYLNGVEVINDPGYTDETIKTYTLSSEYFVEGENLIAIFIKQNWGGAFLDYALYYEKETRPSDDFDIGFLPDVSFEFFYDAKLYDEKTGTIPNHKAANLAGYNLKIDGHQPSYSNIGFLSIKNRCEGFIDKWDKYSTESGNYFFRSGNDCMTIVCRVKPELGTGNTSDLIANRGDNYNYMFRVGDNDDFFLHTGTAYEESRAMSLAYDNAPQVLAVRVDGSNDYIQLDNFTTGESKRISGINWGNGNNIMKFFYNDDSEYYTGDVYWLYYSKKYIPDEELKGIISYGSLKSYNLTYIVDGEVYEVVKIEEGAEITPLTPTKEGHTFSGWKGLPQYMPAKDITVTGHFNVNYYNVTYYVDGEVYKTVSTAYGNKIVMIKEPAKEGHTFSGWSEAPETMPANDIVVEGKFSVNYYTITYMVDGEKYAVDSVAYGTKIALRDNPTKEGHTFSGWSEVPETMPANDIVVEGKFSVNYYAITYMVDGEEYAVDSVAYGAKIQLRDEPTKEGCNFSGWSEVPKTMPANDIVVEGTFSVNYYAITYMVDGEEYTVDSVAYGAKIELRDEPTKEGHTFGGWSEAPETMPANDIVVEGKFSVNYYAITYMVDGEEYAVDSVAYGTKIELRDEPAKEGHTFGGWSETPETMPANDIVVEGKFSVNYYTITYIVDGEEYAVDSVAYGAEIKLIDEPIKDGYTFNGWECEYTTMPAMDIVVYGTFTATGISAIVADDFVDVYTLNGVMVKSQISVELLEKELSSGVYIINGKKVYIRQQ